ALAGGAVVEGGDRHPRPGARLRRGPGRGPLTRRSSAARGGAPARDGRVVGGRLRLESALVGTSHPPSRGRGGRDSRGAGAPGVPGRGPRGRSRGGARGGRPVG